MSKVYKYCSRILGFWFQPVDSIRLDFFQRCFSITFLVYMGAWYLHSYEWLTSYGFHYTKQTKLWFYPDPFPLLPYQFVPYFGFLLFGSTLALIVGWQTRRVIWLVLGCAIYVHNIDVISSYTLNVLYVVVFLILALSPRVKEIADENGSVRLQSAWPLRTLQAIILIQYGTAGLCKIIHGDWLKFHDVLWTQIQGIYCTDFAAWLLRIMPVEAWSILMYSALAFEVLAPVLFIFKRTRLIAIIWGISFQLIIALTMHQLIFFSAQLITFYILFLDERILLGMKSRLHECAGCQVLRIKQMVRGALGSD